jgi:uncharacterized protein YndB with AHSA1/START domain
MSGAVHDPSAPSAVEVTRSTRVTASPAEVWAALAAFDQISSWAPDVDHSVYTTDRTEGIGAARRVQIGRMALIETVTVWEPHHVLAYTLEGLPPLVRSVTNRWILEPLAGGATVSITTSIDPGNTVKGRIGARILSIPLGRGSRRLLDGLTARLRTATP